MVRVPLLFFAKRVGYFRDSTETSRLLRYVFHAVAIKWQAALPKRLESGSGSGSGTAVEAHRSTDPL